MSGDGDGVVAWPLSGVHARLLDELAHLIARAGSWRFLHGPVIAADDDAFPDAWDGDRASVGRLLARTLWHARVDLEIHVDDQRTPARASDRGLQSTSLELRAVDEHAVRFALAAIGNDDVGGLCAHEVGRVFVAHLERSGPPFRRGEHDEGALPGARTGSLAAVYLGLGVLATNAARYDRSAGRTLVYSAVHEFQIAGAGGLDSRLLAFLLAVQATVRDDVLPALDVLRPTQAADVAAWRDVLDAHEDELVARLGLAADDDDDAAPPRPDAPRAAVVTGRYAEDDLTSFNLERRVYRLRVHRGHLMMVVGLLVAPAVFLAVALAAGAGAATLALGVIAGFLVIGPLLGWTLGRRMVAHQCDGCGRAITPDATTCWFCRGTIAGDIRDRLERFDHDDEADELTADALAAGDDAPRA